MHTVIIVEKIKRKVLIILLCDYAQKCGWCFMVYVIIDKKKKYICEKNELKYNNL